MKFASLLTSPSLSMMSVDPSAPGVQPPAGTAPAEAAGTVMAYTQGLKGYGCEHELMTRMEVVRRLARLKGFRHSVERPVGGADGSVYYVPSDTLVGVERAHALGIHNREHLFGGVVPLPFVSTKAITHPLIHPQAAAPEGWNPAFPEQVREAVLNGYSAFSHEDALEAGIRMLELGEARVKPVRETGGRGQTVVRDAEQLKACLATIPADAMAHDGVVIEENLREVDTLSVGQVSVAGLVATYHGYQRLVKNRHGDDVYGGSTLTVVRGDFNALLATELPQHVRLAVEQAMTYDVAAMACFPGFFASRINYDIAQGVDAQGQWRSGVLEQSWRAGGATGCEIAALEAFVADPARTIAVAAGFEVHGECQVPEGATVYFQGVDPHTGPLTKYTVIEPNAHAS